MQLNPSQLSMVKTQEIKDRFSQLQQMIKDIPEFDIKGFDDHIELIKASIDAFANCSKQSGYVEGCLAASNDFIKMAANLMQEYSKAPK
jgi:hypothetical protein